MTDRTYEVLKALYGEEFARKYLAKRRVAEVLSKEELKKIREFADKMMPQSEDFRVKYENHDVLLVETPTREDLRQLKETSSGNYKATVVWNGAPGDSNFVAVFGPKEVLEPLTRPGLFYIVGRLNEREYNGRKTYAFNCVGVIDLTEGLDVSIEEVKELSEEEERAVEEDFEVEEFFP